MSAFIKYYFTPLHNASWYITLLTCIVLRYRISTDKDKKDREQSRNTMFCPHNTILIHITCSVHDRRLIFLRCGEKDNPSNKSLTKISSAYVSAAHIFSILQYWSASPGVTGRNNESKYGNKTCFLHTIDYSPYLLLWRGYKLFVSNSGDDSYVM